MVRPRTLIVVAALSLVAWSAPAQTVDQLTDLQVAVACAPPPEFRQAPAGAPHIVASQDTVPRSLFGKPELLVVNAGTDRGIELNQQYFVRRLNRTAETYRDKLPHALRTAGWVHIVAVNSETAIASVDHACGDILAGDYLEKFEAPVLPTGDIGVPNTDGEPDFAAYGRVLAGADDRRSSGTGEFMMIDRGRDKNVVVGAHFAIYRDLQRTDLPLTPVGEATAVSVGPNMALVLVTRTRDAVYRGDIVVPRVVGLAPPTSPPGVARAGTAGEPDDLDILVNRVIFQMNEYRRLTGLGESTEAAGQLTGARQTLDAIERRR